ncbi:MAG: hypothetical protein H6569_04800 [Lewinellaceae bacterium]|nr:hypothetical protein [Lewinellaceae bacterium]
MAFCFKPVKGQQVPGTPQLYPANVSVFDVDAGLPISCVYSGLVDKAGRLWVNPCFSQEEHRTVDFYKFDGTHSAAIEWKNAPADLKGQAVLSGFTKSGELFGFFRRTGTSFIFNPDTRIARFQSLNDTVGIKINYMGIADAHGIIIHALSSTHHLVYRLGQDKVQLLVKMPRLDPGDENYPLWETNNTLLTQNDLWVSDLKNFGDRSKQDLIANFGTLIRYNLATGKIQKYTPSDLFSGMPPTPLARDLNRAIVQGPQGSVLVYLFPWKRYFRLDPTTETIRQIEPFSRMDTVWQTKQPHFIHGDVRIENDQVGNTLFIARYGMDYQGILQDKNGDFYDYTPVLKAARDASRFSQSLIHTALAHDFKRQTYLFMTSGLAVVDLKLSASIQTRQNLAGARAIAEIAPGQYIVNTDSKQLIDMVRPDTYDSIQSVKSLVLDCPGPFAKMNVFRNLINLVKDSAGYIWAPCRDDLLRFGANGSCAIYSVGKKLDKLAFVDATTIVFVAEGQLFLYDIQDQKVRPQLVNGMPVHFNGTVNQICIAKNGLVWVAALNGLHRINLEAGTYRVIGRKQGFQDERMMCIEEDSEGQLWIGTYGGGLHIYNPETGALSIVDQKKGLSNNIVAGILTDNAGVRWISTYRGITLVSAKGEALSRLYAEDGLSSNEFNRISYLKGSSGELLFGTINGVNILQPEALKDQLLGIEPIRIFLTQLSYFDPESDSLVNKINWPYGAETIKLPAAHRSINLQFALSNLVRYAENGFAYKLEGQGIEAPDKWIYIGANRELSLQNLPAGKYRILIRGCDYRGNWTPEPLVIPIEAAEFFYKQYWFIALCVCALLALILAWMYQQRIERKQLENELLERTDEIMRTRDQLVVQEKLASLGQLTAGIAHEIKNPLNFVNNFAMDSSRLAERFLSALEKEKNSIDPDQYDRIAHYLEEMKQNALDIKSSGSTADRIVRSMMDHARGTSEKMQLLDLNHLVEENVHLAISGFRATHSDFFIELDESYDPAIKKLYASPLNLARAVLNILNNACYALHEKQQQENNFKPALQIRTSAKKHHVEISIRDNGPGIEPEVLKDIFTPFFTTKPTGEGNTGLGLSICYDIIVVEHGGQLEVNSEPGVFTEFRLSLPDSKGNT